MKIVTWNCNGGFRKKLGEAESLDADVYVIQECEDPARSTQQYRNWAGDYLWVGPNKNKGIGVFPKNGISVSNLSWQGGFKIGGIQGFHPSAQWKTQDLELFLPFRLDNKYNVLGCWTKGNEQQAFGYVGQLWKYIQIHGLALNTPDTLVIGDLNSNSIWDKQDRWWSHSGVVQELEQLDLHSLYHLQTGERQGCESIPTFYLHRNILKSYHTDYVFVSGNLTEFSNLEIGDVSRWLKVSDHMPITLEIN